jgi:hypothetical protein
MLQTRRTIRFDRIRQSNNWEHHEVGVHLDGAAPRLAAALSQADEEISVWEMAGAKGISFLTAQLQEA